MYSFITQKQKKSFILSSINLVNSKDDKNTYSYEYRIDLTQLNEFNKHKKEIISKLSNTIYKHELDLVLDYIDENLKFFHNYRYLCLVCLGSTLIKIINTSTFNESTYINIQDTCYINVCKYNNEINDYSIANIMCAFALTISFGSIFYLLMSNR